MNYSILIKTAATVKAKHPDALILLRDDEFYRLVSDDAKKASEVLGTPLTYEHENGFETHFKHHELDWCLPKIIRAGYRVCICDCEDPDRKKLAKRGCRANVN